MGFEFTWDDDAKTLMRYTASGDWNWKDYHLCVRMSLFTLHRHETPVDILIDFSGSSRESFPAGIQGHVRTFTRRHHPSLTGRVVVIGCPPEVAAALGVVEQRLQTADGVIRFVSSEDAAREIIAAWRREDPQPGASNS